MTEDLFHVRKKRRDREPQVRARTLYPGFVISRLSVYKSAVFLSIGFSTPVNSLLRLTA